MVSKALGQPIVIENRPGGGSVIGMDAVAKAAPDGYTLVMTDTSIAVNPSLKPLPYDTLKDFEPVSLLATAPVILMAHPKVPAKTLQEFVALAKAQPGKFNYASGGNGASTHLGGELLKLVAGIDVVHVPYKGTGPAMNDLIGGHVDVMFSGISSARPYMDAGTLRALAVTGETRNAATPDVPTFAEAGLAGRDGLDLLGRARAEGHAEGDRRARQRRVRQGGEGPRDRRTHRAARLPADRAAGLPTTPRTCAARSRSTAISCAPPTSRPTEWRGSPAASR